MSDKFKKVLNEFDFKEFLFVNIGVIIMTTGFYFFLVPANLVVGGASGLAIVLNTVFKFLPVSAILFILNLICFVLGVVLLGRAFGGYTLYASMFFSLVVWVFETLFPMDKPLTDDMFINLIFGIMIGGIGHGLVLNQNASTGGTDIVGKIFEKYTRFSLGMGLIISDGIITIAAGLTYGAKLGLYALLGVILNSLVVDKIIEGFNSKYNLMIVSTSDVAYNNINEFIIKYLNRGSTIYKAHGGYSGEDKNIINTIVDRDDYLKIKKFVSAYDPKAFVYVSKINEVEGEGFSYDVVKKKKKIKDFDQIAKEHESIN